MLESVASQDVWRDERSRIVVVGALEELVSSKHIIEAIRKVEFVSIRVRVSTRLEALDTD